MSDTAGLHTFADGPVTSRAGALKLPTRRCAAQERIYASLTERVPPKRSPTRTCEERVCLTHVRSEWRLSGWLSCSLLSGACLKATGFDGPRGKECAPGAIDGAYKRLAAQCLLAPNVGVVGTSQLQRLSRVWPRPRKITLPRPSPKVTHPCPLCLAIPHRMLPKRAPAVALDTAELFVCCRRTTR